VIFCDGWIIEAKLLHGISEVPLGGGISLNGDMGIEPDGSFVWETIGERGLVCSGGCCHVGSLHVNDMLKRESK
jgi:hypothetical protein